MSCRFLDDPAYGLLGEIRSGLYRLEVLDREKMYGGYPVHGGVVEYRSQLVFGGIWMVRLLRESGYDNWLCMVNRGGGVFDLFCPLMGYREWRVEVRMVREGDLVGEVLLASVCMDRRVEL